MGGGTLLLIWRPPSRVCPCPGPGDQSLYFLPCAALALISHVKNGLVDRAAAGPAALAGAGAAPVFALLATAAEGGLLRRAFGVFLLAAGCAELLKKE